MEGLDLVSTTLGLLINLVEHDASSRAAMAASEVAHAGTTLRLLCRVIQVRPRNASYRRDKSGFMPLQCLITLRINSL